MTVINDNIVSMASALGQKSSSRKFVNSGTLSDSTLLDMYHNNWAIQKYVDKIAEDMTKKDREIKTPLDSDQLEYLNDISTRLDTFTTRKDALVWASLLGESLIVAITSYRHGETPKDYLGTELNLDLERIERFIVFDKTGFDTNNQNNVEDITSRQFNKPEFYQAHFGGGTKIHHSRCYHLKLGKQAFKQRTAYRARRGTSDIQSFKEPLMSYLTACVNVADIIDESKTDVMGIQGFNQGVASGNQDRYIEVATAMRFIRSSTGMMLKDKDDLWEQKELTYTGLVEIIKMMRDDLVGAMHMPLTLFFGQSASGFASGEEDNRNYCQTIESRQESRLRGIDEFLDQFIINEMGLDLQRFRFIYPSIEVKSETEAATIMQTTTTALSTMLQDGVITEAQYAEELRRRNIVSCITDEDIEELEDMNNEEETPTQTQGGEAEQTGGAVLPQATIGSSQDA